MTPSPLKTVRFTRLSDLTLQAIGNRVDLVFAIDPGNVQSGWVVFGGGYVFDCGLDLNLTVLEILQTHAIHLTNFACEEIRSYGMAVGATVFETCFWTGRFIQAVDPMKMHLIPRKDVKQAVCHNGRAKDPNVRQALIDRFGCVGTKKNPGPLYGMKADIWAALGVAVTFFDTKEER